MIATFAAAAISAAGVAARLGWMPDIFWAATPADLRHALGTHSSEGNPADRDLLALMMEANPDG